MLSALRVARTLWHQGMPVDEIRAVLTTDDPVVVRRHLELHQERLQEWVSDQQRTLATVGCRDRLS